MFWLSVSAVVPLAASQSGYTVEGDTVFYDTEQAFFAVTPHTLKDSGFIYLNVTSKVLSGDVDFAFGYDNQYLKPLSIERYQPQTVNETHSLDLTPYLDNETLYSVDYVYETKVGSIIYNGTVTVTQNYFIEFDPAINQTHEMYDPSMIHLKSFDWGDIQTKTVYWVTSKEVIWQDIMGQLDFEQKLVNAYDMTRWYIVTHNVNAGVPYYFRIYCELLPKLDPAPQHFKYCVALKPHNKSIQEAIAASQFYLIDPWYDSNWLYRKYHNITGSSGAGTDYQIKLIGNYSTGTDSAETFYLAGNCSTDFSDIRFTDDDGETLLDYWIEEHSDADYAVFWVKVADDLDSNQTIYVYYGNAAASSLSDGESTFPFFDDFNDGSIDTDKWYEWLSAGSYSESGGILETWGGGTTSWESWGAKTKFFEGYTFDWLGKMDDDATSMGFTADERSADGTYNGNYEAMAIKFHSQKYYYTQNGGSIEQDIRGDAVQYYTRVSIRFVTGAVYYYLNDTLKETHTSVVPTSDSMGIAAAAQGANQHIYSDWCFNRKYVVSEPVNADWGDVETEEGGAVSTEFALAAVALILALAAMGLLFALR